MFSGEEMLNRTKDIKKKINKLESIEERIDFLKDSYKDKTAYLITCGPSLTKHDKEELKEKLKDKLVICCKQAQKYLGDIADFHTISVYNYQPYDYPNEDTIVWWQITKCSIDNELDRIVNDYHHPLDVWIPVVSTPWIEKSGSVAYTKNFDLWKRLATDIELTWGPGIMYESGFPLAIHLGCKNIVTIGWDIGDISKYESNDPMAHDYNWFEQHATELYDMKMQTGPELEELTHTINCTKDMYDWFKKENINVKLISDTNPADNRFKRITLGDI
tara:strand:- start:1146 stop:1970 length:825 start_codon:yes stop_codon:yes gene_type:complete